MRGELVFPAYYIWTIGRIKIGFLGYTDPLVPLRQSPNYSKGIIYSKPEDNLAHYVDVLRNQENCAAVLVIAHLGLSQQIHLANLPEAEGVDYVLGGDTHERVRTPIQCTYAKVVEPGAFGSFVGKLKLRFKDGKLVEDRYDLIEVNAETLTADATIASLIKASEAPFSGSINEVIGYSKVPLYRYFVIENTIDTMITDALRWRMPEVDLVLSNGFRFCPPRATPDHTGNIPITSGYLFDMLPVDSPVRTAEATGAQIKEWLEKELHNVFADKAIERFGGWVIKFNGMHVEFNAYAPKGKRVQTVRVGKKPLDPARLYRMSACERDGDPMDMLCRIKGVKNASNQNFSLHDVLRDYLKAKGPVSPKVRGNAKVLDAPQTLLTQVTGVPYAFR
jgi:2',3'-cyclic-nucleotide 2'-phosphodiesterase (5'-nucleotidase family)